MSQVAPSTPTAPLHDLDPVAVVSTCASALESRYVFPDLGRTAATTLRDGLAGGRYAAATLPGALAELVTADLQQVSSDLHLRLLFHEHGAVGEEDEDAQERHWAEEMRRTAGGIRSVQRWDDGTAVLSIGPVLGHPAHAGRAIRSAMALVADADALLVDVRGCRGGSPDGVVLLLSHLFGAEPVRLSDIDSREEGLRQFWTVPVDEASRFGTHKPVAVVVGPDTFSGGEALAFDLQEQGRATVVGQPTRGGAHPRVGLVVHPQLELTLPVARSVSLFTGGDWEGAGVQPDLLVDGDGDPLAVAHSAVRRAR